MSSTCWSVSYFWLSVVRSLPPPPIPSPKVSLIAWELPPPTFHKLNFDGSVRGAAAVAGFIIHTHDGQLLRASTFNLGRSSIIIAEATALHQGLRLALFLGLQNIIIEGDNLLVIKAIKNAWSTPWKIANIIANCKILLTHFANYEIRHVFREANRTANWIANVGHLVDSSFDVTPCNNSALNTILVTDTLGIPLERRLA